MIHLPPLAAKRRFAVRTCFAMLAAGLLAACGGSDGDAPPQTSPPLVLLTGTAMSADARLPSANDGLAIKGLGGLSRPGQFTAPDVYSAKTDGLDGPYALGLTVAGDSSKILVSLATRPGIANVTPLTTLVVAQATGQDPSVYFSQLGNAGNGSGPLAGITDQRLADAEKAVRRYLRQRLGVVVPDSAGSFVTSAFKATAGDPMFDTLVALNTKLEADGQDVLALAHQMVAEAVLCNAEHVTVAAGGDANDFCPKTKTAQPDDNDDTLIHYQFTALDGGVLSLVARDAAVLSAGLANATGATFACSGSGCAGLSLGAPAADRSRAIVFAAVAMAGTTGSVVIDGSLLSAKPGVNLPPLPCTDNRYYVIHPDDSVAATCAAPDALGLGAGETDPLGQTRREYLFTGDGSVDPPPPSIEVRADGQAVASVVVYDQDPDTGANRVLFKCSGTACNGVTIGDAIDDPDSFAPYVIRMRTITLADTILPAVTGSASTDGSVTLRANLESVEYMLPPVYETGACASPTQRIVATLTGESAAVDICPPADTMSNDPNSFLDTSIDADGRLVIHVASLVTSSGSSGPFGGLDITTDGGAVVSVNWGAIGNAVYRCEGAACAGIVVGAPDGSGQRAVSVSNLLLTEVEMGNLPGTRTATLNGGFVAPALPPVVAARAKGRAR